MSVSDLITKVLFFFVKIYRFFKNFFKKQKNDKKILENSTSDYSFNSSQDFFETHNEENDQNFIKKDDFTKTNPKAKEQADIVVEQLKHASGVRPNQFHQRNLDLEVGGLEKEQKKEVSGKDLWDDRSEEVDEMSIEGNLKAMNTSAKRSMIWRIKKKKMEKQERTKEEMEIAEHQSKKHTQKVDNQRNNNQNGGRSL